MLDALDLAILEHIQRDNRRSLRELAVALGVSPPTCLRRLRRLQRQKLIRAHVALLDPERLGLKVMAYVEVRLVDASGAAMRSFERHIRCRPEVRQMCEMAGDVDYLLQVWVTDADSLTRFAEEALASERSVRSYTTRLVLRRCKDDYALPLPKASR
jgi:Lrp/AsnC family transcriptional regulator, leucine-responsive regulatory protein